MSKILAIYSTEPRIGKTMLGINLGVSLINETRRTVVLVDFSAEEEGVPAWAALKFSAPNAIQCREQLTLEELRRYVLRHSSELSLLTVSSELVRQDTSSIEFVRKLFELLQQLFDYIIVEVSPYLNQATCGVIDLSDILLFMASSSEYECPVEIIGHPNFRLVLNQSDATTQPAVSPNSSQYWLPVDTLTVETFWQTGTPFVIQFPHRPLSQMLGRLTRDITETQVGIALTGGAALSFAQLGVLEVLQQHRIAIDMFTGTSFGALIGAALAQGIELQRLTRSLTEWAFASYPFSWLNVRLLRDIFLRRRKLQALCDLFLQDIYFDDLQLPVNIIAIDIRSGAEVVFREGKVLDAVMFSMRIPGLFVPFKQTEPYIIDGSVLYPTTVGPLKELGAHLTIAVQVTPSPEQSQRSLAEPEEMHASMTRRVAKQNYFLVAATFDSLMERLNENPRVSKDIHLYQPDLLIAPPITDISWHDFHKVEALIDYGRRAAEEALPAIEILKSQKQQIS